MVIVTTKKACDIVLHIARKRENGALTLSHYGIMAFISSRGRYCSVKDIMEGVGLSQNQMNGANKRTALGVLLFGGYIIALGQDKTAKHHYTLTEKGRVTLEIECIEVKQFVFNLFN